MPTLAFALSLLVVTPDVQQTDLFGTWEETRPEAQAGGTVVINRRGAGLVAINGAGHQDGNYGLGNPLYSRHVIGCADWTYQRAASWVEGRLSLIETGLRRPGCSHGQATFNIGEEGQRQLQPLPADDGNVTHRTNTELLLSVADGVLTIETRTVGPNGPVTVSTKKYHRR